MRKENIGSSFDDFLREDGIYEEVTAVAAKRVLARQISKEMEKQHLSKSDMAKRMHTSRSALDRFLDPENDSVTLNTIFKAATAIGKQVNLEFVRPKLVTRTIFINNHNAVIRLEEDLWYRLENICRLETISLHDICTLIDTHKKTRRSLASAIRVFLLGYERSAQSKIEQKTALSSKPGGFTIQALEHVRAA